MNDNKINYFQLYKEVWDFHKKYQSMQKTEEFWQNVMKESKKIVERHEGSKFAMDLLIAVMSELKREERNG